MTSSPHPATRRPTAQLRQGHLQELAAERGAALEQLARVEAALARFNGLPADLGAARAAHRDKQLELERLRLRLRQGLETLM